MKIVARIAILTIVITALENVAIAQPTAETLYTEGQHAYDRAEYAAAVAKWQASYDLSKERGLLFNLAQAMRLSGDCTGALATYRSFVANAPDPTSEQHKLSVDFVRELEGECPTRQPAVVARPKIEGRPALAASLLSTPTDEIGPSLNDPTRQGRSWKIAGLVTGGVGVVTIAIGLGLGHHGATIGDEVTAACRTSCDWAALKDKDARGARDVTIGKALDVIGVAAVAGGAVFYYLGVRQETLTVTPAPGGGGVVSWSGSW